MAKLLSRWVWGYALVSVVCLTLGVSQAWASIDRSIQTAQVEVYDGQIADVSVISYAYMQELFDQLIRHPRIPFKFPDDGCYARAHKMSLLLEQKGIMTIKSFVIGDLRVETPHHPRGWVEWWYHVAPALYVKDFAAPAPRRGLNAVSPGAVSEDYALMIFDPSIFDDPVSYGQWVEAQIRHRTGKVSEAYNTVRFVYTPSDISNSEDLKDYLIEDLVDMETTLELYKEIERARHEGVSSEDYIL